MEIILVRIAIVFMLDPDIPVLLKSLAQKEYVTAHVRPQLEGATISFIEPPNIVAGKGVARVYYDFGRRTLGVESPSSGETLDTLKDVEGCLKEMGINVEKALIPLEVTVLAEASLEPRFTNNTYNFADLLGFNLRLAEAGFVMEGGDPSSQKWLHVRMPPLWSSYETSKKENLYRITAIYRDEKPKLLHFLENLEDILERILSEV